MQNGSDITFTRMIEVLHGKGNNDNETKYLLPFKHDTMQLFCSCPILDHISSSKNLHKIKPISDLDFIVLFSV